MKPQALFGIVLIIIGVVILTLQGGFSFTHQKKVIDAGPIQVNAEKKETVPVSPIIGVVCIGAGIFVTVIGMRKS